ncbi:hypothetical protein [Terriglobus tenax]|uniref:hypothetical protein n=1 Tax=Terriglobus tenax TaxID=1111115 RepID=UPI0021DF7348|nr:hypothetical protein [Terriglobus tenax]
MTAFFRNIEMVLNLMSLPVIVLVHLFLSPHFSNPWKMTAVAAMAVALLHGSLGWLVRRRQRSVRDQILGRMYTTLAGVRNPADSTEMAERMRIALAQLPLLRREPLGEVEEGELRTFPQQERA